MLVRPTLTLFCTTFVAACAVGVAEDSPAIDAGADHQTTQKMDGSAIVIDASAPIDAGTIDDVGTVDVGIDAPIITNDSGTCAGSGTLATYDFSSEPGNQTSTPATSSMSGVTAGSISRASTITAVAGTGSINGSNWSTSSLDATRYYTVTLTPSGSCALDITSIAIDTKTSGTGPANASLATSNDSFASKTSFTLNASTTATVSVSGSTKAVEIRVYGFDATGTAGTMRIQNTLTISGASK